MTRAGVALTLVVLAIAAPARGAVARAGQPVMGTVLQVTVIAPDYATARRLADATIVEARRWDDILTTWRSEGELAGLNARAGRGPIPVSVDLAAALGTMLRLNVSTEGAFDPAVARAVRVWSAQTPRSGIPEMIMPLREVLTLTKRTAALAVNGMLDSGAIGKGIAVDAIAALLRAGGATAALVDFGGSSQLAIGAPPESPDGWRIVVAGVVPGTVHGEIALRDAAMSTSQALGEGADAGPIIDPRTARPVTPPRLVTVLGADGTATDAWSTALVVLGRRGITMAGRAGLQVLFEDAGGVTTTPGYPLRTSPHASFTNGVSQ